jgi:formate dehydrogenase maturation protein FdhE
MVLINPVISDKGSICCRTLTLILKCACDGCGASVLNKYRQFVGSETKPLPALPKLDGCEASRSLLKILYRRYDS